MCEVDELDGRTDLRLDVPECIDITDMRIDSIQKIPHADNRDIIVFLRRHSVARPRLGREIIVFLRRHSVARPRLGGEIIVF